MSVRECWLWALRQAQALSGGSGHESWPSERDALDNRGVEQDRVGAIEGGGGTGPPAESLSGCAAHKAVPPDNLPVKVPGVERSAPDHLEHETQVGHGEHGFDESSRVRRVLELGPGSITPVVRIT